MLRTLLSVFLFCSASALAQVPARNAANGTNASSVPALVYTVVKGDTAYSVAKRNNLSVDALLSFNGLSSPDLEVGQVLALTPPTYTVVKGDTAYSVAKRNNLSVDALLSFNGLSSPDLEVGQVLRLNNGVGALASAPAVTSLATPGTVQASLGLALSAPLPTAPADADLAPMTAPAALETVPNFPMSSADWLANAQSLLGVPYVWGGKSKAGTDCSGFVLQVFGPLGINLPRTSAEQAQTGLPIDRQQVQRGDLLFFDTEGRGKVTHVGIALGGNTFINANTYAGRVAIDDLGSRYWASRYLGARRVLGVMAAGH